MSIVGERLKQALDARNWTANKLSTELRQPGRDRVHGCSTPAVQRYLSGGRGPGDAFVEAAAEVLGVRAAWLRGDSGGPDVSDRALMARDLHEIVLGAGASEPSRRNFDRAMREDFPEYENLTSVVIVLFGNAVARWLHHHQLPGTAKARGKAIAQLGRSILDEWETYGNGDFTSPEFTDYAIARLHAFMLAVRS